ncbi:MAG: transglutaminase domain-containing protein [Candidatus Heimdallarchaeota archaeon]|nr:transglutaminase domain-containing protein [Candidatus Heimdallarchaeota archaeon]
MNSERLLPLGWQIHHQEQLKYRVNSGSPFIRVKFYHYPPYRQNVEILLPPTRCKVQLKGLNTFYTFQGKIHTKGILQFERIIRVFPIPQAIKPQIGWGNCSEISLSLRQKYQVPSMYWPLDATIFAKIQENPWFKTDDLYHWTINALEYITKEIKFRENQKERFGAVKALLLGYGDCDEFTDVFITLARLKGIPSRRLTGYFIQKQGEKVESHAWGEIYSPHIGWIVIDAALGNIGKHTRNYVILKVEEFNHELSEYRVQTRHRGAVHYEWIRSEPNIKPLGG